jgi:hypothetical protein
MNDAQVVFLAIFGLCAMALCIIAWAEPEEK